MSDPVWQSYKSRCCGHHPEAHDDKSCILCKCKVKLMQAWTLASRGLYTKAADSKERAETFS